MSDPQIATLHEIETHYSVDDVLRACELLDSKIEAQRKANEKP